MQHSRAWRFARRTDVISRQGNGRRDALRESIGINHQTIKHLAPRRRPPETSAHPPQALTTAAGAAAPAGALQAAVQRLRAWARGRPACSGALSAERLQQLHAAARAGVSGRPLEAFAWVRRAAPAGASPWASSDGLAQTAAWSRQESDGTPG